MEILAETRRLYLRKLAYSDVDDLFEMDSDPEVHLYIEQKPVSTTDEIVRVIDMLKIQYQEFGTGRWAVVDKLTNECVGWSGLKYFNTPLNGHIHFYELGYRFKRRHWGKGYATESSAAVLDFGFQKLNAVEIFAITDPANFNSRKVLKKLGFDYIETFDYEGDPTDWFRISRDSWNGRKQH